MALDTEALRERYTTLNDDALLEIDRTELTSDAQQIYDAEIQRRSLEQEATHSAEVEKNCPQPVDETDEPDWRDEAFIITTYMQSPSAAGDAAEIRDALIASGIPSDIEEQQVDPEEQPVGQSYVEYRVLIPPSRTLQANSILDVKIFNPRIAEDWKTNLETLTDAQFRTLDIDVLCAGLEDRVERLRRLYREEAAGRAEA